MKRELALEISRVTEAAALASAKLVGHGKKDEADQNAVKAMRHILSEIDITSEIVIGEGEIDEAPMLYIGEKIGNGTQEVDIAVDPIDGTRMLALGQENAVSVIVAAPKNTLLKAPDMYMEKLMVSYKAKGAIDIDLSIEENLKTIAVKLKKRLEDLTVLTLYKERHFEVIENIQNLGVKVIAIPDGDVAGSIKIGMPGSGIDVFYGIGGAPEGVISAAIMQALDGDMQAKLIPRDECKGKTIENTLIAEKELRRCNAMGVQVNKKLTIDDLCSTDNIIMSVTGITEGTLLDGVKFNGDYAETETLLIRGKTRTIRKINSTHFMQRKNKFIKDMTDGK